MKQQPSRSRVVEFLDEGVTTPIRIEMTEQLAGAVARAVTVNEGKDRFLVSFTSLFIGLLSTPDPTGEWIRRQFDASRGNLNALLKQRGLDLRQLETLRSSQVNKGLEPGRAVPRSASARSALTEGQRLARDLGTTVDTRHLMSAYLSIPAYHDQDFRNFQIDRVAWTQSFAQEMSARYPGEAAFWQSFPGRVFPQANPAANPAEDDSIDLEARNLEPHVVQALRTAAAMRTPVEPRYVLRAVVMHASSSGSAAFKRFAEIAPSFGGTGLGSWTQKTVRLSASLARQFAIAQRPRAGESGPRKVWGRDLITAALLCNDKDLADALDRINQPIDLVRDRWFAFVAGDSRDRTREEWVEWWSLVGLAPGSPRRSGIATETDQGDDKLGIEAEARAFARLIMDRQVQPPLSIGLLGDWGSGKSFFIEQIKKQIESLKAEGRPELFGNVVEIEFNAWHASDSNLWASLVTYIFDEIWREIGGKESPQAAREFLLKAIGDARGAISESEQQVERASKAVATAIQELEDRKAKLAWKTHVKEISQEKLTQMAKEAGWQESIETITDVNNAVKSLTVSSRKLKLVAEKLLEKPVTHIALPTATLAVFTIAVWFAVDKLPALQWMQGVPQWAAAVLGGLGAVAAPIKAASAKVNQLTEGLSRIQKGYDEAIKSPRADPGTVAEAHRELESAEACVTAAKARLTELLNQQAALDPQRRLGAFLEERVQTTAYRSQQGIISLVHNDFRQLSKYMKDLRDHPESAEPPGPGIKSLERIVLYVDDLDRCRPAHVVHMLEAVHLLLALDLFVVVVAVDSRWLTRALELHYRELLGGDDSDSEGLRASTPQNYLEKIFQVTYALGPMDPAHFKNYVAFLAGAGSTKPTSEETETFEESPDPIADKDADDPGALVNERAQIDETAGKDPALEEKPQNTLPPSYPVRIDEDEQKVLCSLVPLLPTPRVAKRLINVYRLIKAGKTADALEEFQNNKRAASNLLMLAILFGKPLIASQLLRGLHEREGSFKDGNRTLREAIKLRTAPLEEPNHIREEWQSLLSILNQAEINETVEECAREPLEIARYSLVSGHDWHTWSKPRQATQTARVAQIVDKR